MWWSSSMLLSNQNPCNSACVCGLTSSQWKPGLPTLCCHHHTSQEFGLTRGKMVRFQWILQGALLECNTESVNPTWQLQSKCLGIYVAYFALWIDNYIQMHVPVARPTVSMQAPCLWPSVSVNKVGATNLWLWNVSTCRLLFPWMRQK